MLVLSLFMLDFGDLLYELISLLSNFGDLRFMLSFNRFDRLFEVIDFLRHTLHLCFVPLHLKLSFLVLRLSSVDLLLEIILVVDVLDPLLQHVVNRIDCLLDILRLRFEQIPNSWHTILDLSLNL